jgi:hypothetical protein
MNFTATPPRTLAPRRKDGSFLSVNECLVLVDDDDDTFLIDIIPMLSLPSSPRSDKKKPSHLCIVSC